MQIKSINVGVRKKFNTGNFESVDVEVNLSAEIGADEDEAAIAQYLIGVCKAQVKEAAPPSHKKMFSDKCEKKAA